jgi:hypothetical protein
MAAVLRRQSHPIIINQDPLKSQEISTSRQSTTSQKSAIFVPVSMLNGNYHADEYEDGALTEMEPRGHVDGY